LITSQAIALRLVEYRKEIDAAHEDRGAEVVDLADNVNE